MKHKFTKYLGRVTENLELAFEDKFIYIHYTKGNIEKTACILKTENKTETEYLESFFADNNVSEEMRKDIKKFLKSDKGAKGEEWNEFANFLMKTLSLNMVFGITIALTVFAFYKLGSFLDNTYNFYPLFTLIGTFFGIGIGGLTGYVMFQKYLKKPDEQRKGKKRDKSNLQNGVNDIKEYPIIEVSIEQVRKAVRVFSENLPKGVYRTILIQDDNSIDFNQLADILGGIPSKKIYMSKETYDLFEESERKIPVEMDMVQKAVDLYVKERKEYPMLQFDPQKRVNYYQLIQEHYLKAVPDTQFYITDLDGLITHIRPEKRKLDNSSTI